MPRGSQPGERPGGRQKGTPNKKTREFIKSVEASGLTPLEWMLSVLRDKSAPPERRDEMAKVASLYVHPFVLAVIKMQLKK
jgi:hypothetical protein